MNKAFLFFCLLFSFQQSFPQLTLSADGPGQTYELINSTFAPGYNVVESPDCNHGSFGRHIEEVFDSALNKHVFQFHIHKFPDNDRCMNFDRQRNEIKTYDKSPDSLKAVLGERVRYTWKFKLSDDFQPSSSFTHLHQIKAVGGSKSSMPQFTLTARKSSPDRLELRYAQSTSQTTVTQVPLAPFKGEWVSAVETIYYGETGMGQYDLKLTKVSDGIILLDYSNTAIRTWKTNADFQRPKWGIYRSLNDSTSLKDESVLFADLGIEELDPATLSADDLLQETKIVFQNPLPDVLTITDDMLEKYNEITLYNTSGQLVFSQKISSNTLDISFLSAGLYFISLRGDKFVSQPVKGVKLH